MSDARTPRKTWLSAVLAFFVPGLGHLYAGQLTVGLSIGLFFTAVLPGLVAVAVWAGANAFVTMIALVCVSLALRIAQTVWAALVSARGTTYQLQPFNRLWIYIVFSAVVLINPVTRLLRHEVIEAFKIPSGSMIPALEIGDQIFVTKLNGTYERGDIVVFTTPMPPHEQYLKRIIALGGEEVAVVGGVISINGEAVVAREQGVETFVDRDAMAGRWHPFEAKVRMETLGRHEVRTLWDATAHSPDFGPARVPEGHVFVMGDNRDHAYDSRAWGPVPVDSIIGHAEVIWWSWGPEGLRGERVGKSL